MSYNLTKTSPFRNRIINFFTTEATLWINNVDVNKEEIAELSASSERFIGTAGEKKDSFRRLSI